MNKVEFNKPTSIVIASVAESAKSFVLHFGADKPLFLAKRIAFGKGLVDASDFRGKTFNATITQDSLPNPQGVSTGYIGNIELTMSQEFKLKFQDASARYENARIYGTDELIA